MTVWEVESENLTHLGGPMGTEYTTTNWRKLCKTLAAAKRVAEEDFRKPIAWIRAGKGCRSDDFGHVMYRIQPQEVVE